jgi:Flp pilus assembly protein CpaB
MRRRSSRFYLIISICAAALAAITLLAYLQGLRSRIAESGRLVPLVVAANDLEAGELLDSSSFSLVDFPDRYLLPGTSTDPLALSGRTLRHAVREGEPVLESTLLPLGAGGLALGSLERGFRAYPLPSSAVSFPPSELQAGSRVDILSISRDKADPLLEDVEVLLVYGTSSHAAALRGTATISANTGECILLQVTSEQACRLAAARESGAVELLLRPAEGR